MALKERTAPHLVTALPGPKTQALIARDEAHISPSYTRGYPLSIARGEGAVVEDVDGNLFLDFCAGIAVTSTGHCHPQVVEAVREQAGKFLHMSGTDFYYDVMATLAERLAKNTPGTPDKKVFLANSGTEAIEGALKLARHATGRQKIISFYRSFHGRTFGAMSVSASKTIHKAGFSPLLPGVLHAHYPYPYRAEQGPALVRTGAVPTNAEECVEACLDYLKNVTLKYEAAPHEIAAIILEPVQGEGGYVVPPKSFFTGLRKLADEHGFLIIADEVQCGVGRTGKLWASEHFGFVPDILVSAKGIASGMPLGAFIARSEIMDWPPGAHATTFGGNPVSCAAALATLDLVEGGLTQNAATMGERLMKGLSGIQSKHIGEVRGLGLMVGMEIVKNGREKAADLRDKLVDDCFERGLLILGCGENTVRFSPSLIVNEQQVDTAVGIVAEALKALE